MAADTHPFYAIAETSDEFAIVEGHRLESVLIDDIPTVQITAVDNSDSIFGRDLRSITLFFTQNFNPALHSVFDHSDEIRTNPSEPPESAS